MKLWKLFSGLPLKSPHPASRSAFLLSALCTNTTRIATDLRTKATTTSTATDSTHWTTQSNHTMALRTGRDSRVTHPRRASWVKISALTSSSERKRLRSNTWRTQGTSRTRTHAVHSSLLEMPLQGFSCAFSNTPL